MMKAIVLREYGPPSALGLEDVEKPAPSVGEIVIKVGATAVNDWDWAYLRGRPFLYRLMFGLRKPKHTVLGVEVAGTVETVGIEVESVRPGDDVYGDISEAGLGGFAEYVCVPESAVHPMAPSMTFEQAAALPHAAMLALQGIVDVGRIQQGDRVLINGGGGGVGIIGVQIAKEHGAEVTGVDSAKKLAAMQAAGFDHVIDYRETDFTRTDERYDLILDAKSTRSPLRCLRSLNKGGRYATVGGHLPRLAQTFLLGPLISRLTSKQVGVVALRPNRDLAYINDLFETKGLRAVVDGPYPLRGVPAALQRFGDAEHLGKVVITVDDLRTV